MSRHSSRGTRWERIRAHVLERDGYRCRKCRGAFGASGLEVHHRIPKRYGGTDEGRNLVTLCAGCHIQADKRIKNPARAEWEAYLGV